MWNVYLFRRKSIGKDGKWLKNAVKQPKSAEQTTKAMRETTKAAEQTTIAKPETTKAAKQTTKATRDTTKAAEQTTKAKRETTKPAEQTTIAKRETTKVQFKTKKPRTPEISLGSKYVLQTENYVALFNRYAHRYRGYWYIELCVVFIVVYMTSHPVIFLLLQ